MDVDEDREGSVDANARGSSMPYSPTELASLLTLLRHRLLQKNQGAGGRLLILNTVPLLSTIFDPSSFDFDTRSRRGHPASFLDLGDTSIPYIYFLQPAMANYRRTAQRLVVYEFCMGK